MNLTGACDESLELSFLYASEIKESFCGFVLGNKSLILQKGFPDHQITDKNGMKMSGALQQCLYCISKKQSTEYE